METWTQIAAGVEIVCDNADGIIEGFNLTYHTKAYIGIEVIRNVTLWCFQTSGWDTTTLHQIYLGILAKKKFRGFRVMW